MKLSELDNTRAAEVLCEIAPLVGHITQDEKVMDALKAKIDLGEGATKMEIVAAGLNRLVDLLPLLMGVEHRRDLFGILAIVNDEGLDAFMTKNFGETVKLAKDLLRDPVFLDFFS